MAGRQPVNGTSHYSFHPPIIRCEVKRLVTMTAWCTQPGPNNKWLVDWIINPLLLNGMIKDMATMEEMLERTDPEMLDYTIVRPCGLVNGKFHFVSIIYSFIIYSFLVRILT